MIVLIDLLNLSELLRFAVEVNPPLIIPSELLDPPPAKVALAVAKLPDSLAQLVPSHDSVAPVTDGVYPPATTIAV